MFRKILPVRTWISGLLIIVGLGLVFYFVLGRGGKSALTDELLTRELILARSQTANLTTFFQARARSIVALSKLSSMKHRNEETVQDLDGFVEQWSKDGLIGGIILTNKDGLVELNSNISGTRDTGASVADRDYYLQVKDEIIKDEYFIGKPVISRMGGSKGQTIVPVAAPVYQNQLFGGVVAVSVILEPLTERFLSLMKISDSTEVYLINQNGDLLYSNLTPDSVGSNIFESPQANSFLGGQTLSNQMKAALAANQEGKLETAYLNSGGSLEVRLIAYSPVKLETQNWLLVIASPIQDVVNLTTPAYIRQAAVLILVSLSLLAFGIITTRNMKANTEKEEQASAKTPHTD
ncbi:MAG: cache domain-containing protein [bacterium]|nr:cache domain-containing protein [bacterium]